MKIIKNLSLAIGVMTALFVFAVGLPITAVAAPNTYVCQGVNPDTGVCDEGSSVTTVIKTVINLLSWIVGVIAVIMIIIAGLTMVTSAGDAEKAKKAKSTITYALVGMVVVMLVQVIVRFVISRLG
jgi:uncharacterized membrane protein